MCYGSWDPTISWLSKKHNFWEPGSLKTSLSAFSFSILVAPSAPYFVFHCSHFGLVWGCLGVSFWCPASQVSSFSSLNNSSDVKVQSCCCWRVTRAAATGSGSCAMDWAAPGGSGWVSRKGWTLASVPMYFRWTVASQRCPSGQTAAATRGCFHFSKELFEIKNQISSWWHLDLW